MTKIILLCLAVSLNSFAQTDELTLESSTAPTIIEDGTDLSDAPAEEPLEAPDSPDVTENAEPLINNSHEDKTIAEPHDANPDSSLTEMADSAPEEVTSPNPLAEDTTPDEEPKEIARTNPRVSTPVISSEMPKDDRYIDHHKSHWITTFGFEGMKYPELPWDFEGTRRNVRERDQELYGARLGLGGQLYIGGGLFTTTMVEAFYVGTFTRTIQVADPDVEGEEAGGIKRTGGLWGGEVAQQLGFIKEFRTKNPFMDDWAYLTFEPFVEAGLGVSRAYHSVDYNYDTTGTSGPGVKEMYKVRLRDELTNARVGAGFNLTSRTGFFMQAKVSINRYDITNRKINSYVQKDGQTLEESKDRLDDNDVKIDPITVITLGGGYKF